MNERGDMITDPTDIKRIRLYHNFISINLTIEKKSSNSLKDTNYQSSLEKKEIT